VSQYSGFISRLEGLGESDGGGVTVKTGAGGGAIDPSAPGPPGAEAKRQDPHVQQRLVAHLLAEAASRRADPATAQTVLHQVSQAVHPFAVADSRPQTSAQVETALHREWRLSARSVPAIRVGTRRGQWPHTAAKSPAWRP